MDLRDKTINKLEHNRYDVLIIGGGINGAVAAASLAARGGQVALVDKGDFACLTSQNSSNLVWGGIKYMESFEFPLVRKLCKSRNHLLRSYPSAIKEIRFYTNLDRGFRHSSPILYFAALLYWGIGNFITRAPRFLSPLQINQEEPLVNTSNSIGGVEYSDAYLYDNDARFVFNFIGSAIDNNCIAVNYVESLGSKLNTNDEWLTKLRNNRSNKEFEIRSKVIINACGPYVDQQNQLSDQTTDHHHVFSKGIHLIVPRIIENERVLTFFADDGRMFFAIPMGGRTMIGTTDTPVSTPDTKVTEQDRQFVLDNINKRLNLPSPITDEDIISERCGVRPLVLSNDKDNYPYEDWTKLSRKHEIDINQQKSYISIFGGKLTDCINIGEEVCEKVERLGLSLPQKERRWYGEPDEAIRKEYFHLEWAQQKAGMPLGDFEPVDVQATLLALTATTIMDAVNGLPVRANGVLVCGGGVHNQALMDRLRALCPCPLDTTSPVGVDPDWVEAMCFAWLAKCHIDGTKLDTGPFTGAHSEVLLGALYPA